LPVRERATGSPECLSVKEGNPGTTPILRGTAEFSTSAQQTDTSYLTGAQERTHVLMTRRSNADPAKMSAAPDLMFLNVLSLKMMTMTATITTIITTITI